MSDLHLKKLIQRGRLRNILLLTRAEESFGFIHQVASTHVFVLGLKDQIQISEREWVHLTFMISKQKKGDPLTSEMIYIISIGGLDNQGGFATSALSQF